jgi:hypothetical protein
MSEVVLTSLNIAGQNLGTFVQRIIHEVARAGEKDVEAIKLAMVSAIRHFDPLRLWFREQTHTFELTVNQQTYTVESAEVEGYPADFITPKDVYILVGGTRWLPLKQVDIDDIRWLTPTSTVVGPPKRWAWYDDKIWFTPIPNEVATSIRIDYYSDIGTPSYSWDGAQWIFKGPNGEDLADSWASPWLGTNAEELLRARVKWDLYFNYYDDAENAIKMGGMSGEGGYVDMALNGIMRKHNRRKYNVGRRTTTV